jgi:hypothetical protein
MGKFLIAVALSMTVISSCNQPGTLTREEVIAAIESFDKNWKNKNAAGVDSILASSYIYFTQSGGTFDRKNVVQTAGSAEYKIDSVYRRAFDIKIEGNTAVVNTTWYGRGIYYGTPFDDLQRCSITVIKKGGKVLVLSEHCTPLR